MYGMFGAETGYLPFFPGAESVTATGRQSILAASKFLTERYGGKVIYNDTDSAYCYFASLAGKTVSEIWAFAEEVVEKVAELFDKPMKLEFEGKIYVKFMIFTKKKYVAQMLDSKGVLKENLYMRGVPLVRREYVSNMKFVYRSCVDFIFKNVSELVNIKMLDKKVLMKHPLWQEYISIIHENFVNALSFNIKNKTRDDDKRIDVYKEFTIFKGLTKEEYKSKQAHVEVANKMKARGTPVGVNSRIEYILMAEWNNTYNKKLKQFEITEDLGYYKQFRGIINLDFIQYFVSQYVNYLDQMTSVIFGVEEFIEKLVMYTTSRNVDISKVAINKKTGQPYMHKKMYLGGGGSLCDKNLYIDEIKRKWKPVIDVQITPSSEENADTEMKQEVVKAPKIKKVNKKANVIVSIVEE